MRGEFPHSSPAVSVLYTQRKLTFVPDAQTSFEDSFRITMFEKEKAGVG